MNLTDMITKVWEVAEAASPAPWMLDDGKTGYRTMGVWCGHDSGLGGSVAEPGDRYPRGANHPSENMAHIALNDPTVTQAWCDVVEAAGWVDELYYPDACKCEICHAHDANRSALATLKAVLEAKGGTP